jgi:hypothetical protein
VVGEGRVICFSSRGRAHTDGGVGAGIIGWMTDVDELEARLDPARFFRISRAAMIEA